MRVWRFYKEAENGFQFLYFKSSSSDLMLSIYQLEKSGKNLKEVIKLELS